MKNRMLQLALMMMGGSSLALAQQPTPPMKMSDQREMACMMGMHSMMMGEGMMGGMMPSGPERMGGMRGQMRDMKSDSSHMRGMMGGSSHMGGMMSGSSHMGGMMNDSSHMAQMRSELGMSEAQMAQLHTIARRACAAAQPHMALAMQARQAAMQALQGENPSLDHFEDQLDKAAKHMVAGQVEMAKGMIEVRKALTPAQRQKMDQMHHKK